jgi:hypothetical protein
MIPGNANPLLLASAAAASDTEFSIQKSVRFNDDDSAHFTRTPSAASNRRTFTWSGWFKRSTIDGTHVLFAAGSDANNRFALRFSSGQLFIVDQVGGGSIIRNRTEQQFRDVSSWYHFVIAIDSTQSTSSDRLKMYVNGSVVEDYDITNYPSQNQQFNVNSTDEHYIGKRVAESQYFDGYMANVHFIDGLGLAASDFGFYDDNGVWRPKEYTGTFGTNGFHLLDFANESTLGHDSSGNNNDWTANNFSTSGGATDVLFDSPTNGDQSDTGAGGEVSGNYCTLNPLDQRDGTLSNGNLDYDLGSGTKFVSGTIAVKSGKWFWEAKAVSGVTNGSVGGRFGLSQTPTKRHGENGPFTLFWHATGGIKTAISGTITSRATGTNYADSDILGLALDADANIAYFYKNGSLAYTYDFSSLVPAGSQFLTPSCWNGSSGTPKWKYNFGQRAFAHSARSNHKVLCTASFGTPTIADGSAYFDTKLYTGNGSTQTVSGLNMSPDLVWMKTRSQANDHVLVDSVRGVGVRLFSNDSTAENTQSTSLTSFNSDGFSLGSHSSVNQNNVTHVAWAWDAGSSTVSNTDGNITSSVRANTTAGFSIVTATQGSGTSTWGHGLNTKPDLIIMKARDQAFNWYVSHSALDNQSTKFLRLDLTSEVATNANWFNSTEPTNSVVSTKAGGMWNQGDDFIAYCFRAVPGYSAFGSYEGTGTSEGALVFTGMRPAWVMIKRITTAESWVIYDTSRNPFNKTVTRLFADLSNNENDNVSHYIDILSNGFKVRSSGGLLGASGDDYSYVAFAENPFQANGGLAR